MKVNKKLILSGVITTVAAGSLLGVNAASATTSSDGSSIVDKLVTKFNLNRDDVQAVFDEQHDELEAERKQEMSDSLQDKVDSGDITAEQKTLIENKFAEQKSARENERTELEKWASDNDIDLKYLMGGHGPQSTDTNDLEKAVSDGKISEAQKTLIEQKRSELDTKRKADHDALEQWASDNGIDLQDIMPMGGRGFDGPGGGHPMM